MKIFTRILCGWCLLIGSLSIDVFGATGQWSLTPDKPRIQAGQAVTLTFETPNVDVHNITINDQLTTYVCSLQPPSCGGNFVVGPTETTTYVLNSQHDDGSSWPPIVTIVVVTHKP
jgi:hypothetical protein